MDIPILFASLVAFLCGLIGAYCGAILRIPGIITEYEEKNQSIASSHVGDYKDNPKLLGSVNNIYSLRQQLMSNPTDIQKIGAYYSTVELFNKLQTEGLEEGVDFFVATQPFFKYNFNAAQKLKFNSSGSRVGQITYYRPKIFWNKLKRKKYEIIVIYVAKDKNTIGAYFL